MEATDPATGQPLPADAIQRVLFLSGAVHVYNIPPLASTKGYMAATWTEDPKRHIFTARLRVLETALPTTTGNDDGEEVKVDVVLEDPKTAQLFAAAPYIAAAAVEPALDSSRFFALRVQDEAGRKAILGIGFEERPEAFDFSVALQEARKTLGFDGEGGLRQQQQNKNAMKKQEGGAKDGAAQELRDLKLKDGETITVNLSGTKFGRRKTAEDDSSKAGSSGMASFSLPPPPSAGPSQSGLLPPPPAGKSHDAKSQRSYRRSGDFSKLAAEKMGFDDGQFGEFA